MKKAKRLISLLLAVTTVFTLCGCQSGAVAEIETTASDTETIQVSETVAETTEAVAMEELTTKATEEASAETEISEEATEPQHDHSYTRTVIKEATCAGEGVERFECVCGSSYEEKNPKKQHTYSSQTVAPTCTEDGYTIYTCKTCKASYEDNRTDATGHSWRKWKVTKEATITSTGTKTRTCSVCKEKQTEVIEKIPHTHNYTGKVTTKAKCEAEGEKTFTCSCGDSYAEPIPAKGHSFGEWKVIKEATITSTGTKTRTCSDCKKKETAVIEKIPHSHSYTEKVTTKATCSEKGLKTFTCSCGDSYTEEIPATGHVWNSWKVTKEATESNTGKKERSCKNCKEKEYQTIPKVEHTHSMTHTVTKPTCTAEGYTTHTCSTCTYSYTDSNVAATGHSFGGWNTETAPTETASGLAKRICSACEKTETKVLGKLPHVHSYTVTETVTATCTTDGYVKKVCSCGDVVKETLSAGHHWEKRHQDEVGHWNVYIVCHCGWRCSAEGNYVVKFAAHVNSIPIEERYEGHSYYDVGEWVVDTPARDWTECAVCGTNK